MFPDRPVAGISLFDPETGEYAAFQQVGSVYGVPVYLLNGGGGGTASAFGSAFPTTGTAAGAEGPGNLMQPLQVDGSGNLKIAGSIAVTPATSTTVSAVSIVTVGTGTTSLLAASGTRTRFILQNVGTTQIYILFGAGTASSVNYHIILPPGGSTADGFSAPYIDQQWLGAIQASSSGAGGSVSVSNFTP